MTPAGGQALSVYRCVSSVHVLSPPPALHQGSHVHACVKVQTFTDIRVLEPVALLGPAGGVHLDPGVARLATALECPRGSTDHQCSRYMGSRPGEGGLANIARVL